VTRLPARRRSLLVGSVVAALAALVVVSVAFGTPPLGVSTTATLADGSTVNTIKAHVAGLKLHTNASVEVFQTSSTAQPGFSSGWHQHTGPVIVNVTAGALNFYQPAMSGNHVKGGNGQNACTTTNVTAGHAFIEEPGRPIVARNEGTVAASWVTTQIIPVGASHRDDVSPALCGVS
jgi:quercetin dioxygenase-like cupin family protein